ncbi:MAG: hypothetical protein AUG44_05305 [Actinobacteria bacterium 13_1_20CM_3_71_11]|nr:MAG: hypothetical protein AUG44_05305 [Actinobacteria bacterium 13_1_20CM_3_71_11]
MAAVARSGPAGASAGRIRDNGDSPSDGASQNSSSRWSSATDRWYRPRPVGTATLTRALSPSGDRAAAVEHLLPAGQMTQHEPSMQIAASLVISTRTAESHVEHIMTKLGLSNRAQIASRVGTWSRADSEPDR